MWDKTGIAARVEALLFVFFVALLVQSVIEREMRSNMKKAGLKSIPIYHEKRQCASPTTDKVLNLFNNIQRHHLTDNGVLVKTFNPKLNEVQALVLDLLDIPQSVYTEYSWFDVNRNKYDWKPNEMCGK